MKKNLKTKMFLSVATLGLALVSTIGSTYAWFTINTSAEVTGIDMSVTAGTRIDLKENGVTTSQYRDTFTVKTFNPSDADKSKGFGWGLATPIGITDATDSSEAKWDTTVQADVYATSSATTTTKKSGWKTSDIVKTVSADTPAWAYDFVDAKQITYNSVDTHAYGLIDANKITTAYYYLLNLDYRITVGYTPKITVENLKVKDADGKELTTGDDIATADKVARIAILDNGTTTGNVYRLTDKTTTTDFALTNVKTLIGKDATLATDSYAVNKLVSHTVTGYDQTNKLSDDGSFYEGNVKIYVWYDGTDYAASNAIMSQQVTFDLKFVAEAIA